MKRRTLLKAAGVGVLATSAGVWGTRRRWLGFASRLAWGLGAPRPLSRALDHEQNRLQLADDLDAFDGALKQARHLKKPVLVFVIPEKEVEQSDRADLLSNLLNAGRNEDLALLALAEVVCARMEWVRTRFPKAPAGEPWVLVVDEHTNPTAFHSAEFGEAVSAEKELAQLGWPIDPIGYFPSAEEAKESEEEHAKRWEKWERQRKLADEVYRQQTNRVGDIIRQVLVSDDETVARRGRLVSEGLTGKLNVRVENALFRGIRLTDAELDIVAPYLYLKRDDRGVIDDLAHLAVTKYRMQNVPGSRWAVMGSCGMTQLEDEAPIAIACGMGGAPMRSRRFLDFYHRLSDE